MAKLTLTDITSGFDLSAYNANNSLIEAAIENTLSRDGTTPNTMSADIDMNSNDLNNVINTRTQNLYLNGVKVTGVYPEELTELTGLTDTTITSPGNLNALMHDGTDWKNRALTTADIQSGTFANGRIAESNVTQHQTALTILESQITDAALLARNAGNETITGTWFFDNDVSIGVNAGGDSNLEFYDDTNNTYRSIFWDDSEGAFFFEDDAGAFQQFGTGSGGGPDFLLGGM